jgi:hypothetical protein
VIIASTNKNLGPVGVHTEDYIKMGLDHLLNPSMYTLLTEEQAAKDIDKLWADIYSWTICHRQLLSDDAVNFIRKHLEDSAKDPLGYFYLLIKLNKQPISGRPVCLDCESLPHALGCWVDETLQPIVKDQALYLKNSAALKEELERMEIPHNASMFTYDAVAMYPSINMAQCIARLLEYLSSPEISSKYGFSPKALLEALTLVMLNNRMRLGDIIVKQLSGIAMGMLPAPTIANLFMAIYENTHVLLYIPQVMLYLRRFIDNGFGIWLHDPDPLIDESNWREFQANLNSSGIKWIFSDRSNEVVFMDLQLKIKEKIVVTSLYAKPMVLHLYIPPHSCHAPGVLPGIVFRNVLRIHQQCSRAVDVTREIKLFLHCFLNRGYQLSQLTPLFQQAMENAKAYLQRPALDHLCAKSKKGEGQS